MRKRIMRVCVLFLVFAATVPCASADEGEKLYRKAADHYYSFIKSPNEKAFHSNWDMLIREFQKVAEEYPESHKADDAWYMVGKLSMDCYRLSGNRADLESALNAFAILAERYPESTLADDAGYSRGEIYLKLGNIQRARREYELVVRKYRRSDMVRKAHSRLSEIDSGKYASKQKSGEAEAEPSPPLKELTVTDNVKSSTEKKLTETRPEPGSGHPEPSEKPSGKAQVRRLRYYSGPDYTRVVIDLDQNLDFLPPHLLRKDPSIGAPPRLYVDFPGAILGQEIKAETRRKDAYYELPISDGLLRRARVGQFQEDVVRVVLDIERIDRYHFFTLPGEAGSQRFVIDVFGSPLKSRTQGKTPGVVASPKPTAPKGPVSVSPPLRSQTRPARKKAWIIVVDPGHGGKDPGAVGQHNIREKDIALRISLKLKRELEKQIPGVKVILTRSRDEYLTLVERTAKANAADADLFLSIHCNASPNRKAYGIETYYLDNTTDRAALKLAARENFVSEQAIADDRDLTNQILADLLTNSKVEGSIPLAGYIQESLIKDLSKKYSSINDLGVKKAPFWVLTGATMPCVLIETSFISHQREEKRLASNSYQEALAMAIARGTKSYLKESPPFSLAAQ